MSIQVSRGSVANAAVYLSNWATLKLPATGKKKLLGDWPRIGLPFILLPMATLFLQILSISCQFREFLSPFDVQEHSIHQFQGLRVLKTLWRGINIDYLLHAAINSLIVFPLNWVILTAEKRPNLGNWLYIFFIKIGLLWSPVPQVKKPICHGLVLFDGVMSIPICTKTNKQTNTLANPQYALY